MQENLMQQCYSKHVYINARGPHGVMLLQTVYLNARSPHGVILPQTVYLNARRVHGVKLLQNRDNSPA